MAANPSPSDAPATGSGSKKKMIMAGVAVMVLGGGLAFFVSGEKPLTPPEMLQKAVGLVQEGRSPLDSIEALKLVDELDEQNYVDPDFPAGISFVRGMTLFYEGLEYQGDEQQKRYLKAIEYFEQAWPRAMPEDKRAELTRAYGVALQIVGLPSRARPLLRDSYRDAPDTRLEVGVLLVQNLIDQYSETGLQDGLRIAEELAAIEGITQETQDQITLMRASILNQLGRTEDATKQLDSVSPAGAGEYETRLLRATALMAEGRELKRRNELRSAQARFTEARALLEPLRSPVTGMRIRARASWLNAQCAEETAGPDDSESAIFLYQDIIRTFAESDEWLAGTLRLGRLMQSRNRDEEALQAYRDVLRSIDRPDDFRNRWITIRDLQKEVRSAWTEWIERQRFQEAIDLAAAMSPLVSHVESLELVARASELRAINLDELWLTASAGKKRQLQTELRQRWAESGTAYEHLASAVRDEKRFPDVLWNSALHFAQGYEFAKALERTNEFIAVSPTQGLARAWVHRGRVEMNLDRLDDAFSSFQFVIDNTPTDPNVFEAQYLIGRCQLELDRPEDAERTWRAVTSSEDLKPSADVWRLARFSLGRLLVQEAANDFRTSQPDEGAEPTNEQRSARSRAFARWREAIQHLDEYLKRYEQSQEGVEARYLLARSLQRVVEEPRSQLSAAMPANARAELFRSISALLTRAIHEYEQLQLQLQEVRSREQLDEFAEHAYRATFMQIPHAWFELEKYPEALDGYRSAVRVFPDDVVVLTAYIQMARCYQRMGRTDETRRQIEQARIILTRLPDSAFDSQSTGMTRQQWSDWLEWAATFGEGQRGSMATTSR